MNNPTRYTIWRGKSWRLCSAARVLADGTLVKTTFIDHPGAVVLVPWLDDSPEPTVLMLRQYRHALADFILELPAGTRGENEDWNACAQRELREETGQEAEQLIELGRCWPAPGVSNEIMAIYLACGLHTNPLPQDDDEEIEVVPYPFNDLVRMALDGSLLDAKSIVGILRTARYKRLL